MSAKVGLKQETGLAKQTIHTTFTDVFKRDNYVFVSFEPGSRGHTLGRVLCALPDIHWYSTPDNGINPWNVSHNSIRERHVARKHFNRVMPNGVMLPPTHDYISKWIPDAYEYYTEHFVYQYYRADALNYDKRLLFCSHGLPEDLLAVFPNSRIINVIADPTQTAERYMQTSAKFPGWLKHDWMNGTQTEYGRHLLHVSIDLGVNFTNQQLWEYSNTGDYSKYIEVQIELNMHLRTQTSDSRVLNCSGTDYKLIKEFLNDR